MAFPASWSPPLPPTGSAKLPCPTALSSPSGGGDLPTSLATWLAAAAAAASAAAAAAAASCLVRRARRLSTSSSRESFIERFKSNSFCNALSLSSQFCSSADISACKAFLHALTSDSQRSSHSRVRRSSARSRSRVSRWASCSRRLPSAMSSRARSRSVVTRCSSADIECSCSPNSSTCLSFFWISSIWDAFVVRAVFAFDL
mmetsp:Transcript_1251/g.2880  ORF Transcript_1251/g.2880 Transcript_1251/m.2880 type:complete len:202 (+) Transcript_1251:474-1079(+)